MRRRRIVAVGIVSGTLWVACSFSTRIDKAIDASPPDAGPCKEAPTQECADGTTLRRCMTVGSAPMDLPCNWGCKMTGEHHCGQVIPAGGGATLADADPKTFGALGDVVISAMTTIDGEAGTISTVTTGFTRELRATDTIAVFRMKSLTINGPVKLVGAAAIAFVTDGPIVINAIVDARGVCGNADNAAIPGAGGFPGGVAATDNGSGSGGGKVGVLTGGAGGGGFGGSGGSGGLGTGLQVGGVGGVMNGTETITMLFGGGGGGATAGAGGHARGGGGGGAVQFVSNAKITLMSGGINAGGCGGDSGAGGGEDGGGGGGAGGAILLEAPIIDGAGALAVNGGGGGAGDDANATAGTQGSLDRMPAAGAPGSVTGGSGGPGGAGSSFTGTKGVDDLAHGGGGGGGVGRIRLNTRTGDVAATGEMSPALTDANSTCTAGSANVQ